MNIHEYSAVSQSYGNNASKAVKQIKQRAAATHAQGDTVSISNTYRSERNIVGSAPTAHEGLRYPNKKDARFTFGTLAFSNRAWQGEQNAREKLSSAKYYTEPGRVDSEISASRKAENDSFGRKIESVLKRAGIELSKEDKLNFKVSKDGTITVDASGLTEATRSKVKHIEKALNSESGLGKQLMLNSAATALHEEDMRRHKDHTRVASYVGDSSPTVAAAHRETLDDYLRTNLGFGIDELEAEGYGSSDFDGKGEYYTKFDDWVYETFSFHEKGTLQSYVSSAIYHTSKEGAVEFEASYTYQNGTLVDNKASGASKQLAEAGGGEVAESSGKSGKDASVDEIVQHLRSEYAKVNDEKAVDDELAEIMAGIDGSDKSKNDAMEKLLEKIMEKSKADKKEQHVDEYV